jgi:methionine--tRNA ligase beta chain
LKRQSIYQNNLYNTNDTADLGLYGPQWKAKKISFWMCTVLDGAQWTRVEGIVQLIPTMKSLDSDKKSSKTSEAAPAASVPTTSVSAESVQLDLSKVKIEPLFEEFVDFDTFAKSDFRVVKIEACEAVPKSKKLLKFTLNDGTDKKRTILSGIHEYYEPEQLVGKTCVAITNLPTRMMMGIPSEGMLISAVYEYDGHEGLNLLMLDDAIPAGAKLY